MKVTFIHWLQPLHIRAVRVLRCCSAALGASQSVRLQPFRLKTHSCLKTKANCTPSAHTKHPWLNYRSCLKTKANCTPSAHTSSHDWIITRLKTQAKLANSDLIHIHLWPTAAKPINSDFIHIYLSDWHKPNQSTPTGASHTNPLQHQLSPTSSPTPFHPPILILQAWILTTSWCIWQNHNLLHNAHGIPQKSDTISETMILCLNQTHILTLGALVSISAHLVCAVLHRGGACIPIL